MHKRKPHFPEEIVKSSETTLDTTAVIQKTKTPITEFVSIEVNYSQLIPETRRRFP